MKNIASFSFTYYEKKTTALPTGITRSFVNYLHTLLNSTREAIFLLDTNGNIKIYNDYAQKIILQFTGSDISKIPNLVAAVPEWRKADVRNSLVMTASGEVSEYEVRYPDKKWLHVSFFPVYNGCGKIMEICCVLRDVTVKKSTEEQVKKSDTMYRSLVESMQEGVVFQSKDNNGNTANDSASLILGVPKKTLTKEGLLHPGLLWFDQKEQPVEPEAIFCPEQSQSRSVRNIVLGVRKKNANEKITWLAMNAEPLKIDGGENIQGCVFTFSNITETKKNREELNLLSKVIKETSNIVVITDKEEKITWANDSFTRTSEYNLKEAMNHKPGHLLGGPEKDVNEVRKIKRAILNGEPVSGEILNYARSGRKYWTNYTIHPVKDEEGNLVKFFSIQSDITELKRIQEEIVHQRLEHQEQIAFAAIAAQEEKQTEIGQELHDNINQILAATKLYLGPLLKGNEDTRKKAELVKEHIQLAIDEIRKLSHQLVAPRFKEKSLREVFRRMPSKLENGAVVHLEIKNVNEERLTPEMKLALYRITQEQFNNINKHAKASQVNISISGDANQIKLVVADDGIGFEVKQTKNGIGINNIYNRAESLNGTAELISMPGKGCKLVISLPLPRQESPKMSSSFS